MSLSKDVKNYEVTYSRLFNAMVNRLEPVTIPFGSAREASRFRFRCYGYRKAVSYCAKKYPDEVVRLECQEMEKKITGITFRLSGSNLIVMKTLLSNSPETLAADSVLDGLLMEERSTHVEENPVKSEQEQLDDILDMMK